MVRFNWVLAALACAILGATLLVSCESDSPPGPTTDDNFPLCEGNKSDDPSCPVVIPDDPDFKGEQPDTAPSEPQVPAVDYEGQYCPNKGCVLVPTTIDLPDSWNRWQCGEPPDGSPPLAFTATETSYIPTACGL